MTSTNTSNTNDASASTNITNARNASASTNNAYASTTSVRIEAFSRQCDSLIMYKKFDLYTIKTGESSRR